MRYYAAAALGLGLMVSVTPSKAQNLNDIGRQLQNQLFPQQNNDRERTAYDRGRRDQEEQVRRDRDARGYDGDRRRVEEERHRYDDSQRQQAEDRQRYDRDAQRERADRQRALSEDERSRNRY